MLSRFKKSIPPADILKVSSPRSHGKLSKVVSDGVDEITELAKLCEKQADRIRRACIAEQTSMSISKDVDRMIMNMSVLLEKSHNMKMDLGFGGGRNLGTLGIQPVTQKQIREKYGNEVVKALSSPESRTKVLSLVNAVSMRASAVNVEATKEIDAELVVSDSKD